MRSGKAFFQKSLIFFLPLTCGRAHRATTPNYIVRAGRLLGFKPRFGPVRMPSPAPQTRSAAYACNGIGHPWRARSKRGFDHYGSVHETESIPLTEYFPSPAFSV